MKGDYKDNDCESVMKKFQLIAMVVGLLIIIGGVNSSFAATVQVQTNTTFSCTDKADCIAKCKALPGTWKDSPAGSPGGTPFGTCTQRSQSLPDGKINTDLFPTKADLDSMTRVASKDKEILKEVNLAFSKSYLAKELKLENGQIISLSIVLNKKKDGLYEGPPCATCVIDEGMTIALCCKDSPCNDPCRDHDSLGFALFAK